jgi:hypothetical protein
MIYSAEMDHRIMQAMSMCVLDEPMYVDWNKVEWPAFSDRDFLGLFMVAAMK